MPLLLLLSSSGGSPIWIPGPVDGSTTWVPDHDVPDTIIPGTGDSSITWIPDGDHGVSYSTGDGDGSITWTPGP